MVPHNFLKHFAFILIVYFLTGTPARKQNKPLSAHRRDQNCVIDSTSEAQAVMDALKAENQSLITQVRDSHSAPGRHQVATDSVPKPFHCATQL